MSLPARSGTFSPWVQPCRGMDEMEMGMRAEEDIEIGTDITPPLIPLSFCLHHSFLNSHCSACFSLLPSPPIPPFPNGHGPTLFYCSPRCSATDSPLHFSSAEHHLLLSPHSAADSSDLRAALRFLQSQRATSHSHSHPGRIAGLLVNRHKLIGENRSSDYEVCERIRFGAGAMAAAIAMQHGGQEPDDTVLEEATAALCLVQTNAVEVQDNSGRTLGIAVFDPTFCWINHSCSPNACYRFTLSSPHKSTPYGDTKLRIAPFTRHSQETEIDSGFCCSTSEFAKEGEQGCGPRLIVRSIKRIKKGEEVTVTYTDLLQPKAMRQLELWSRYRFICCCRRCSALPLAYVDHALQEISAVSNDSSHSYSNYKFIRHMADRRLTEYINDVISEYLSVGDSESCCEKLEKVLMQGLNEQAEGIVEGKSHYSYMLHPLHHLSLNAYTTLASAYKVHACDLLSLHSEIDLNKSKAFDLSRTSAAYSLLLASATHHLFNSESSLIASLANFWMDAGESLLYVARCSGWSKFVKWGLVVSNVSSVTKFNCSNCTLKDRFRACISNFRVRSEDFENVSNEFLRCVSDITQKVWCFLVYGCYFLRSCKDPINFSWLMSTKNSCAMDVGTHVYDTDMGYSNESQSSIRTHGEQGHTDHARAEIFQLGVHCLVYGGILASICYGHRSHLVCHVQNILGREENFV